MTVQDAIAELYGLAPGEFITARDAKVRELRAGGEREVAAAVAKLRRPSVPHWALNMTTRTHPDAVAAWIDAVAEVRDAQESAASGVQVDMRAALARLRERAAAVVAAAAAWAKRDDVALALNDIAMSEDQTDALRSGALGSGHPVAGSVARDGRLPTGPKQSSRPPTDTARATRARTARTTLERAAARLEAASAAVATTTEAHEQAQAALAAASDTVEVARRQLADAEAAHTAAARKLREVDRAVVRAAEGHERAQHDHAATRLDTLS